MGRARARRRAPTSALTAYRWTIPDVGLLRLRWASDSLCKEVDAHWPNERPAVADHAEWRWTDLVGRTPEAWAVTDEDAESAFGLWCSQKSRGITSLEGRDYYRLDYLEVAPSWCGDATVGPFMLALVAARAEETGCSGITLGSLPGAERFYTSRGGEMKLLKGWRVSTGLVPIVFEGRAFHELAEDERRLRIDTGP